MNREHVRDPGDDSLRHLAGPECRRALARGWLIVVRTLVGLVLALILGVPALALVDELALGPLAGARHGVAIWRSGPRSMILLTIVVVQAPAVLAGSLAGERERGVLQLLLTTAVTPREIVSGRLARQTEPGRNDRARGLADPGDPLRVERPGHLGQLAAFFVLLAAVGFGGGGLAVGASIVSRRGRDALLSVYILMLLLLLSPLLSRVGLPAQAAEWLFWFNPVYSLNHAGQRGSRGIRARGFGLLAGDRSRRACPWRPGGCGRRCLAAGDTAKKSRRPLWVPPLGERPMLWKELYIERVGTLGRFGRWLGVLITVAIGGGSLVLAAVILVRLRLAADRRLGRSGRPTSCRRSYPQSGDVSWAGCSSGRSACGPRSRSPRSASGATWDALLMSPLQAGEIVRAKLFGSLYALRWMVAAMVLAWTLGGFGRRRARS